MYPSARAILFHFFLLLSATCGICFFFSYLYFAASQPASLVSFVTVYHDTKVVNGYQQQPSTSDTVLWTLRRINPPPIDLISLEDYSVTKPTADRTQPSITLQRSKDNNSVCLEYEARQYCSSEASISGIYTHAPTGDSIRFTANTANVSSTVPSYLKESPATNLLLLLQTILAVVYWNARLSPSAVGLLVDGNVEEPWRLFTGATAHFDLWHFGMNMMTLSSLGAALENNAIPSMAFLATNLSMILYTGILWRVFQSLLLRIRRVPAANHPHSIPTVGCSGVLFAWLVVLSLEQGTVCPVFFLPQLCFSSVHIWNGFSIHPGPLVQLILMQLVLPRASWTGHLAGIVVGFVYQWRLLPVTLWWPAISIPMMHFMWCLQQKRQRFLSLRQGLSWRSSSMYMGIVHSVLWVASVLTLGGVGSTMALEYLLVGLWWYSTRSDDTTMARGFILLAVLVLVTDAMTAAAWMVVIPSVWTTMLPSVMTLLFRIVALLMSLLCMIHSHRLYQETPSGIFYYAFHWTVLKPAHGILEAIGATNKPSSQESLSSWDHLGTGRRLGGMRDQEMVQLI